MDPLRVLRFRVGRLTIAPITCWQNSTPIKLPLCSIKTTKVRKRTKKYPQKGPKIPSKRPMDPIKVFQFGVGQLTIAPINFWWKGGSCILKSAELIDLCQQQFRAGINSGPFSRLTSKAAILYSETTNIGTRPCRPYHFILWKNTILQDIETGPLCNSSGCCAVA